MATTRVWMRAPAERVWAVIADGRRYAEWVVGAEKVRDLDEGWPAPGSAFHHRVGVGLVKVSDKTVVREIEPPRRLLLEARVQPLGVAEVELVVEPGAGGCVVTMTEAPISPAPARWAAPLLAPLTIARNRRALRRLEKLSANG